MGLKNVTLQGRLVRDPESRQTKTGTDVCNFTVAVDSNRPSKGEEKNPASFFRVTSFGKRGQTVQQYLHKGDEVIVVGDVELDVFVAQDGKTHANMQVISTDIHFGRKANRDPGQAQSNPASSQPPQRQQQDFPGYEGGNVY